MGTDCSNLFAKLTTTWRPSDIKENMEIMTILKNNPLQIHKLAQMKNQLNITTLSKLAEAYTLKSKLGKLMHGAAENGAGAEQQLMKKQQREQLIKQYISS